MLLHLLVLIKGRDTILLKTYHGTDGIIGESYQMVKELILVLHKLFQEREEEETLFNSLCETSIILIPKTNKNIPRKLQSNILINIDAKSSTEY